MKLFIPILTFILLLNVQGFAHCGGCAIDRENKKDHSHDNVNHSHTAPATVEVKSTTSDANAYEALNLTEDQKEDYDELVEDYEKKFKKLEKDFVKKVKKILTDDQYETFVENNKELKSNTGS